MTPYRIFILTGAGISAESGIRTFRDTAGLWEEHRIEDVATPEGYDRDPVLVLDFYNLRRSSLPGAEPNAAHKALARLEKVWRETDGEVLVCTQNVDNLHERAGTQNLIHMHGELAKARCGECEHVVEWELSQPLTIDAACGRCGVQGRMRPHVVWFGEMPLEMERIYEELALADLFVSIGTSGAVYPAAGFVDLAARAGAETLELNLEPSEGSVLFDERRHGPAGLIVPEWVDNLIAMRS